MAKQIKVGLLKEVLKEKNISYHMLSRRTGISVSLLSMMFSGKRNITINKLNLILDAASININNICV